MTVTVEQQVAVSPSRWRSVYSQRRILSLLIGRDLRIRYSDSTLGYFWSVLEPLLMAGVYWFVFTKVFTRGNGSEDPYIVFLLLGMLPWNWANAVMTGASRAISGEAKLVRSVDVPREIWVLRIIGSKFFEFLFSIPVLVFFMILLHKGVNEKIVWVPVAMVMEWVALTGIAMILAPVTVMMTDVERLVRIVVRMLFYLSPVVYSQDQIFGTHDKPKHLPEIVKQIYTLNPFNAILGLYRAGVYRADMPSLDLALRGSSVSLVLFVVGIWVFRRMEPAVLKEI
jgi:ABC-2 type transport system permease protein